MKVTKKLIEELCILSRLEFEDAELPKIQQDLERMISCLEQLEHIKPEEKYDAEERGLRLREDVITGKDGREAALSNAPKQWEGMFVVPKTTDGQ